tara:strand:- start:5 stop:1366 length:1362 start_codon:yes stop_codon:yes gene_type:complete
MAIEQTFTSNGSTKVFTISEFDFLRTSDIKVFIDPTGGTAKTLVTENTGAVAGQYTINQTAKTITFISSNIQGSLQTNDGSGNAGAPLAGVVTAQRITAVDTPINTFQAGSSITADDLNDSLNQLRFNINEYGTLTNSGSLSDSDKGEITVSNSGNTWTIDNGVVNTAKIANDSVDGAKLTDNIDIAGTFDVTGATTLDSTLGVAGNFSVNTDKFTVAGSDGDTAIAGTLDVDGATTLDGTTVDGVLDVNGSATIDNITIDGNRINTATGVLEFLSVGGVTKLMDLVTELSGSINVTGNTTLNNNVNIKGDNKTFTVENDAGDDKFTVDTDNGDTTITGTLAVTGKSTFTGGAILQKESTTLSAATTFAVTKGWHELTSNSGYTDSIVGATGGTAGQILILTAATGHTITLTDGTDSNDFMIGSDIPIVGDNRDTVTLIYNGTNWLKIGHGDN